MKKYILLMLSFFMFRNSFSQAIIWKPTIGINTSVQSVSKTGNNKIKAGFDVGIKLEIPLRKNIGLEMGYFYAQNSSYLERRFVYPFIVYFDLPVVKEDFKLRFLKVPLLLILKQNHDNPGFIGLGGVIKYNFSSYRDGIFVDRNETYSSKFTIDTESGNKVGVGLQAAVGKEFSIKKNKFSLGLYYDVDLSKWRYPTNFDLEKKIYYSLRSHNLSLLLSWIL